MAVVFIDDAGVKRTAAGYSVLPDNLVILPDLSGRMDATDVTELANDIEVNGQLELAVCWKNAAGWPVLAAGHRRYRAIVKINEGKAEADKRRVLFSTINARNEAEAFDYTIRENRNRVNPSPLDDAHNMHIYQTKFGLSVDDIARKYFPGILTEEETAKAVAKVRETLALLELSDTAQEELRAGKISTSAAVQLAAIPSRQKQDEVLEKARKEGKKVTTATAKEAAAEAKGKTPKAPKNPHKMLAEFKELGELSGVLAAEILSEERNEESMMDAARIVIVTCRKLGVILPGLNKITDEAEEFLKNRDEQEAIKHARKSVKELKELVTA